MRTLVPVCLGLVVAAGTVATIFWRDLHAERQISSGLRAQLEEARAALAARPAVPSIAEAVSQTSTDASAAGTAPATSPPKDSREATAVIVADYAKKAKTLLDDPAYRKARLAQVRLDLMQRYAGLALELGLSDSEGAALFELLAEQQLRLEAESAARLAGNATPDEVTIAKLNREMEGIQHEQKDALVAMLGPARYEQFEEYGHTQPSRTRVNNLTTLLARSGQPLSDAQTRSLTAVIIAEQKRTEAETKAFTDAGKISPQSQGERQAETNRRILESVGGFLDSRQLELLRERFQQRAAIDGAADRLQQREREVLQDTPQ